MSKNVLLMSLSMFPKRPNTNEYTIEQENVYEYFDKNGKSYTVSGHYQLDPIPNLLKTMNIPLDEIIILSTEETRREKELEVENNIVETSEEKYFTNWIVENFTDSSGNPTKCHVIYLVEDNPAQAVSDISDIFKEYGEKEEITLYVDTHGGFRDLQLISEAIVNLWQNEHIQLEVFNIHYNRGEISLIEQDSAIKIFDFVSGINEFLNYGRINSLLKFLNFDDSEQLQSNNQALIGPLKEISEGIQWCNIKNFEDGLRHLKNYYKDKKAEVSNSYLRLFEGKIKEDFGDLLDEDKINDAVTMVRWCMKKGFYQQALTLIESRMPETWKKRGIVKLTEAGNKFKNENNLELVDIYNGCIQDYKSWLKVWSKEKGNVDRSIFNKVFRDNNTDLGNRTMQILNEIENSPYFKQNYYQSLGRDYYRDFIENHKSCNLKRIDRDCDSAIRFSTDELDSDNKKYKKMVLLNLMHGTLKDARNAANHALTDSGYKMEAVKSAIKYYTDLVEDMTLK